MFRTVFPSIIRSLRLYIQHQVYVIQVLWLLASGNEMEPQFHIVPARKQSAESVWHIPDAVCTVLDSWCWTERPSETCRVLLQNKINLRNWCNLLVLLWKHVSWLSADIRWLFEMSRVFLNACTHCLTNKRKLYVRPLCSETSIVKWRAPACVQQLWQEVILCVAWLPANCKTVRSVACGVQHVNCSLNWCPKQFSTQ